MVHDERWNRTAVFPVGSGPALPQVDPNATFIFGPAPNMTVGLFQWAISPPNTLIVL